MTIARNAPSVGRDARIKSCYSEKRKLNFSAIGAERDDHIDRARDLSSSAAMISVTARAFATAFSAGFTHADLPDEHASTERT
ncbi:hypothetical protein [Bradyrhizobium sp. HKCCYLR20261]|uniref:hypothetical protein n=1 Tax=unclassified Bradyrhizobium TaxID=2631580 RepID=UPI003EBB55A2